MTAARTSNGEASAPDSAQQSAQEPAHDQARLERMIAANHACVSIVTHEELYVLDLVRATALRTKRRLWFWSATQGLFEGLTDVSISQDKTEHPAAALYQLTTQILDPTIAVTLDLVDHLQDGRTLRAVRDVIHVYREHGGCLVMIDHREGLPEILEHEATVLEITLPDEKELEGIVRRTLKRLHQDKPVKAQLKRGELQAVVRNLRGLSRTRAEQIITDCVIEDRTFDGDDLNTIFAHKRRTMERTQVLEFIETPNDLSAIGGLRKLKRWLRQRGNALSEEAREFGIDPPRGVMLLGVQGAGKSLSAKAIATAWKRPLLRLDPGALYDRYVGESERRLRQALQQAELMSPTILWIDEIEKGFASAATHSTDGGLSQRMFGTFLTWMQEHTAPVFLVATANNIDALPPELLRKGRFDEIFFVDLPDETVRKLIFSIHLKKRGRDPDDAKKFDLDALAAISEGYSGAEIEQAVIAGLHEAFADSAKLDTERLIKAVQISPPLSVTMAERIHRLREWARGRCVPAD